LTIARIGLSLRFGFTIWKILNARHRAERQVHFPSTLEASIMTQGGHIFGLVTELNSASNFGHAGNQQNSMARDQSIPPQAGLGPDARLSDKADEKGSVHGSLRRKFSYAQTPQDVLRHLDSVVGRRHPSEGFAAGTGRQNGAESRAIEIVRRIVNNEKVVGFEISDGLTSVRLEALSNEFVTRVEHGCGTMAAIKYRCDGTRMLEESEKTVNGAKVSTAIIFDLSGKPRFQNTTEYYPGIAAKRSEIIAEFSGDGSLKKTTVLEFNLSRQEISITTTSVEKIQPAPTPKPEIRQITATPEFIQPESDRHGNLIGFIVRDGTAVMALSTDRSGKVIKIEKEPGRHRTMSFAPDGTLLSEHEIVIHWNGVKSEERTAEYFPGGNLASEHTISYCPWFKTKASEEHCSFSANGALETFEKFVYSSASTASGAKYTSKEWQSIDGSRERKIVERDAKGNPEKVTVLAYNALIGTRETVETKEQRVETRWDASGFPASREEYDKKNRLAVVYQPDGLGGWIPA
jgi:hypothetical protein